MDSPGHPQSTKTMRHPLHFKWAQRKEVCYPQQPQLDWARSLRNDNKIFSTINFALSKLYCHGAFPRKTSVSGRFSSLPPMLPPSKVANFMFIVVSPSLNVCNDAPSPRSFLSWDLVADALSQTSPVPPTRKAIDTKHDQLQIPLRNGCLRKSSLWKWINKS